MKVKDLRKIIKDLPEDMDVFIFLEVMSGNVFQGASKTMENAEIKRVTEDGLVVSRPCKKSSESKKSLVLY